MDRRSQKADFISVHVRLNPRTYGCRWEALKAAGDFKSNAALLRHLIDLSLGKKKRAKPIDRTTDAKLNSRAAIHLTRLENRPPPGVKRLSNWSMLRRELATIRQIAEARQSAPLFCADEAVMVVASGDSTAERPGYRLASPRSPPSASATVIAPATDQVVVAGFATRIEYEIPSLCDRLTAPIPRLETVSMPFHEVRSMPRSRSASPAKDASPESRLLASPVRNCPLPSTDLKQTPGLGVVPFWAVQEFSPTEFWCVRCQAVFTTRPVADEHFVAMHGAPAYATNPYLWYPPSTDRPHDSSDDDASDDDDYTADIPCDDCDRRFFTDYDRYCHHASVHARPIIRLQRLDMDSLTPPDDPPRRQTHDSPDASPTSLEVPLVDLTASPATSDACSSVGDVLMVTAVVEPINIDVGALESGCKAKAMLEPVLFPAIPPSPRMLDPLASVPIFTDCLLCFQRVKTRVMAKHMRGHPPCRLCLSQFATVAELDAHCIAEHANQCSECGFLAVDSYALILHVTKAHTNDVKPDPFRCPTCAKTYSKDLDLMFHRNEFHEEFLCESCYLRCRGEPKTTIRRTMPNGTLNKCIACGELTPPSLSSPLKTNARRKTFSCVFCGKWYTDMLEFKDHEQRHVSADGFACLRCRYITDRPEKLAAHHEACEAAVGSESSGVAIDGRPRRRRLQRRYHRCPICQRSYASQRDVSEHVAAVHATPKVESKPKPANVVRPPNRADGFGSKRFRKPLVT